MIGSAPREWRSDGSPVNGDVYAGFCGGPGGEIPPGYPTAAITRRAIPIMTLQRRLASRERTVVLRAATSYDARARKGHDLKRYGDAA